MEDGSSVVAYSGCIRRWLNMISVCIKEGLLLTTGTVFCSNVFPCHPSAVSYNFYIWLENIWWTERKDPFRICISPLDTRRWRKNCFNGTGQGGGTVVGEASTRHWTLRGGNLWIKEEHEVHTAETQQTGELIATGGKVSRANSEELVRWLGLWITIWAGLHLPFNFIGMHSSQPTLLETCHIAQLSSCDFSGSLYTRQNVFMCYFHMSSYAT